MALSKDSGVLLCLAKGHWVIRRHEICSTITSLHTRRGGERRHEGVTRKGAPLFAWDGRNSFSQKTCTVDHVLRLKSARADGRRSEGGAAARRGSVRHPPTRARRSAGRARSHVVLLLMRGVRQGPQIVRQRPRHARPSARRASRRHAAAAGGVGGLRGLRFVLTHPKLLSRPSVRKKCQAARTSLRDTMYSKPIVLNVVDKNAMRCQSACDVMIQPPPQPGLEL